MTRVQRLGISLVEVLVSVSILSIGLVVVSRSFLGCATAFYHSADILEARNGLSQQIWELRDEVMAGKQWPAAHRTDTVFGTRRVYRSDMSAVSVGAYRELYNVRFNMTWADAGKIKNTNRELCLMMPVRNG